MRCREQHIILSENVHEHGHVHVDIDVFVYVSMDINVARKTDTFS